MMYLLAWDSGPKKLRPTMAAEINSGCPRAGKRSRVTDPRSATKISLVGLPDGVLLEVADYLVKPSRVLFAVAVTAPSPSWSITNSTRRQPSRLGRLILSSAAKGWDRLDFGDVEQSLANRFTDIDLYAALVCIDAVNKLKCLRLTGCVQLIGQGLESLRGSVVLEQIDLSMVGLHEKPDLDCPPSISEDVVLPILYTILQANDNSLKLVQLPKLWRQEPTHENSEFIEAFNTSMNNSLYCTKCNGGIYLELSDWVMSSQGICYGTYNHVCSACVKLFCGRSESDACKTRFCFGCERDYCRNCATFVDCDFCSNIFCQGCLHHRCTSCSENFCPSCLKDESRCPDCNQIVSKIS